jgi:hypothetical protein
MEMCISPNTVKAFLKLAMAKVGLHRTALVARLFNRASLSCLPTCSTPDFCCEQPAGVHATGEVFADRSLPARSCEALFPPGCHETFIRCWCHQG